MYALLCLSYTVCLRCMLELVCHTLHFFPCMSHSVYFTMYYSLCISYFVYFFDIHVPSLFLSRRHLYQYTMCKSMSKSSALACGSCMRRCCYELCYFFVYTEQIPTRIHRLLSQIDQNPRERVYTTQGVSIGKPQSSPSAQPSQFTGSFIALRAS